MLDCGAIKDILAKLEPGDRVDPNVPSVLLYV